MEKEKRIMDLERQERKYEFPYHYIPKYDIEYNNFSLFRVLGWGASYLSYIRLIVKLIKNYNFNSLIDIGCGDGRLLFELRKQFPEKKLTGIDISEKALMFAKAFNDNKTELICKDFTDKKSLTYASGNPIKYDIITLIDVLEHIHPNEVMNFVGKMSEHLTKNGHVIATIPSNNWKVNPKHYQHFSREKAKIPFKTFFTVKKILYLNDISYKANIIKKMMVNKYFITHHQRMNKILFRLYEKYCLFSTEKRCSRFMIICDY